MLDRRLQKAARSAESGIGPSQVDPPERIERGRDQRLLVVPLLDVTADSDRPIRAAELLRERSQLLLGARAQHEPVAGLGGTAGGGLADPARGAGDEEDWIRHGAES